MDTCDLVFLLAEPVAPLPPARADSCCSVSWMVGSIRLVAEAWDWAWYLTMLGGSGGGGSEAEDAAEVVMLFSSLRCCVAQLSSCGVAGARGRVGGRLTFARYCGNMPLGFGDLEVSMAIL